MNLSDSETPKIPVFHAGLGGVSNIVLGTLEPEGLRVTYDSTSKTYTASVTNIVTLNFREISLITDPDLLRRLGLKQ